MKKLIALAIVAGFLAAGTIGCNKESAKTTSGSGVTKATEMKESKK